MHSQSPPKIRFVAIILAISAAFFIAGLTACPPTAGRVERQVSPREIAPAPPARAEGRVSSATPGSAPRHPEKLGLLAVVIDDAGYNLSELEPFLALPGPLAVAVLPNLPHSREAARRVREAGKELLLHCPMEAQHGENPGPGALLTIQTPQELEQSLAAAFASVPGALGMNNHMGSKATADEALMTTVMGCLKGEGKFFLDSRTSSDTVGEVVASRSGVPYLGRDFFIDVGRSNGEIAKAYSAGVEFARKRGSAVLIGHVQNPGVLDILLRGGKELGGEGVRLVRLSEILENRRGEAKH